MRIWRKLVALIEHFYYKNRSNDMYTIDEFNYEVPPTTEGGSYSVSFQLKVRDENNVATWHYYGTLIPEGGAINGVPCIQHDAVQVALILLKDAAIEAARQIAVDELNPAE